MVSKLPTDHAARLERMRLSLDGLSVGDAFGERFFGHPDTIALKLMHRALPHPPWPYSDDTAMALSVCEVLEQQGGIDGDELARCFAKRYAAEPHRGYGGGAHRYFEWILSGVPWRTAARDLFDGQGSMGNGGAMRVAPLGAYFAEDLDALAEHARRSADVTHAHPDGQAGAVALAFAAAFAWQHRGQSGTEVGKEMLAFVHDRTPSGDTRMGLENAYRMGLGASVQLAVEALGNGSRVISSDTVPFAVWCAARHLNDFVEAMWTTVSGLGDRDTTCAMVGGIVALSVGRKGLPAEWLAAREPLKPPPA